MKNHVADFFLFDLLLFGLLFLLYHFAFESHLLFDKLLENNLLIPFKQKKITFDFIMQPQPMITGLYLYGSMWVLGRLLPLCLGTRVVLLSLCVLIGFIFLTPLDFLDVQFGLFMGVTLALFLHWIQRHQCSSLRFAYIVLGLGTLYKGWLMVKMISIVVGLFLVTSPPSYQKIKILFDPVGLLLFISILLFKDHICDKLNTCLATFLPILALLFSFKMDSVWYQPWLRKYRTFISSGLALSLPTGALMALYHPEGLPAQIQPLFQNLSISPYWIWLGLSLFGVNRTLRFRQSLWPELTIAFQIIPLILSGLNLNIDPQALTFLQNMLVQKRHISTSSPLYYDPQSHHLF